LRTIGRRPHGTPRRRCALRFLGLPVTVTAFGGIGKIIGPVGLALIVGSGYYLKPDVPLPQIPSAFVYLGCRTG
jgi:hypothetical protein